MRTISEYENNTCFSKHIGIEESYHKIHLAVSNLSDMPDSTLNDLGLRKQTFFDVLIL